MDGLFLTSRRHWWDRVNNTVVEFHPSMTSGSSRERTRAAGLIDALYCHLHSAWDNRYYCPVHSNCNCKCSTWLHMTQWFYTVLCGIIRIHSDTVVFWYCYVHGWTSSPCEPFKVAVKTAHETVTVYCFVWYSLLYSNIVHAHRVNILTLWVYIQVYTCNHW